MSQFYQYIWPQATTDTIAALETIGVGGGNLTLSGADVDPVTGIVNFADTNIIRTISLTSANNLSAVNFVISGSQNGVSIEEELVGPSNSTVTSVNSFDIVTSIFSPSAALQVSAGIGAVGFFSFIPVNNKSSADIITWAINYYNMTPNTVVKIYMSLSKIVNNKQTVAQMIASGELINITAAANPGINAAQQTNRICQTVVIGQTAANGGTFNAQFLQI